MAKKITCGVGWGVPGTCPESPTKTHSCKNKIEIPDSISILPDTKAKLRLIELICKKHKCAYCKDQKTVI